MTNPFGIPGGVLAFGPAAYGNPYGSSPAVSPFGSPATRNPYGSAPTGNPFGQPSPLTSPQGPAQVAQEAIANNERYDQLSGGGSFGGATSDQTGGYGRGLGSAAPNAYSVAQAMELPTGLVGAIPGMAFGMAGTAVNTVGNAVNTAANKGMLGDLGTHASFGQTLGGIMGMNNLAGTYTGALNMAIGDKMPGFQGIEIAQAPGDFGPGYAGPSDTLSGTALGDYNSGYSSGAVSQSALGAPSGYAGPAGYAGGGSSGGNSGDPGEVAGQGDTAGGPGEVSGGSWAKGGFVSQRQLSGPDPAGPDTGYGALKAGEFVVQKAAVRRLGLKKLQHLNMKGGH